MQSGKLRHRITIEEKTINQDQVTGAITETWQEVCRTWASFEPLSAKELIASGTLRNDVTARVIIRYREINESMRIIYKDTSYNISAIIPDLKSNREYLTLTVSTVLKNE